MASTITSTGGYDALPLWSRLLGASGRGMAAPRCRAGVERGLPLPAGDVTLVADHSAPLTAGPSPTVLDRSPMPCPFVLAFPC